MHGSQSVCCLEEEAGTFVVAEIDTQCGYKIWYSCNETSNPTYSAMLHLGIFPIISTSLHFVILVDMFFAISAQACALIKAWCFFDSNEFGFSYRSSEANNCTHSVNTL